MEEETRGTLHELRHLQQRVSKENHRRLILLHTETVERLAGTLKSVDNVEGSDGLAEGTSDNILLRASIQLTA